MKNTAITAITLTTLFSSSAVIGESTPKFYVFGERDGVSADSTACLVSHKSAISAVQSALRYNQIEIADKSGLGSISVYININSMTVAPGISTCFYSYSLSFQTYVFGVNVAEGVPNSGRMVLCDRGSIASWNRYTAQEQVNSSMKIYTDECLGEIMDKARANSTQ